MKKLIISLLTFGLGLTLPLSAAAPVMHAYLAERFFSHFPIDNAIDKQAFMQGTLFPDIRYLGKINRQDTHFERITLDEVLNEPSSFMAGLKFHSYVDWVREDYVLEKGMYTLLEAMNGGEPLELLCLKLKLLEDELVYTQCDRSAWIAALQDVHSDELNYGMGLSTIRKWHILQTMSFTNQPSTLIFLLNISGRSIFNIPQEYLLEWHKTFRDIAQDKRIQDYVRALLHCFEHRFFEKSQPS